MVVMNNAQLEGYTPPPVDILVARTDEQGKLVKDAQGFDVIDIITIKRCVSCGQQFPFDGIVLGPCCRPN